jgi:hypothetical protein
MKNQEINREIDGGQSNSQQEKQTKEKKILVQDQ